MKGLMIALVVLFSVPCYAQSFDFNKYGRSPLDKYSKGESRKPLADLKANRYDTNSLSNPHGAGSRFKVDGLNNRYSQYGSRYSNDSWTNPYATSPPKLYGADGTYHGELSANRYGSDSTSNKHGRYGSRYSPDSINNKYGAGSRYSTQPIYVYPGVR